MMTLFSPLIQTAASSSAAPGSQTALISSGQDIINAKAGQAINAGFFPLEVALVVLGCLMVTGVMLLMRESRIEDRST
ncbi:hypothetical protein WNY37_13425 [Henriciella sp. AS95]|uniref:hypothetical protein n=1 Tax=Henriciella sp. AS95 TaxID=3135782 RepID=UPI00317DC3CC